MSKVNDYDNYAAERQKDILSGEMKPHSLVEKPAMSKLLPSLKGKTVLMLGCGTGDESALLINQGAEKLVGIDISETSIALAKKSYPDCDFQVGDINKLEFNDGSFDFVYSSLAINYTSNPLGVYEEVFRALKPGGQFLFSVPHPVRWSSEEVIIEGEPIKILGFAKEKDSSRVYGDYSKYEKYEHGFQDRGKEVLSFWVGPPSMHFRLLRESGFEITDFVETKAIEKAKKIDFAYYNKFSKLPQFTIFFAVKH